MSVGECVLALIALFIAAICVIVLIVIEIKWYHKSRGYR